jgi:hypothetical protein
VKKTWNIVGNNLRKTAVQVENVLYPLEVHIECVFDAQTGLEPRRMTNGILDWLRTVS